MFAPALIVAIFFNLSVPSVFNTLIGRLILDVFPFPNCPYEPYPTETTVPSSFKTNVLLFETSTPIAFSIYVSAVFNILIGIFLVLVVLSPNCP